MIRSIESLLKFEVIAIDGAIGQVQRILFPHQPALPLRQLRFFLNIRINLTVLLCVLRCLQDQSQTL